jgi:hypothetical protein
MRRPRNRHSDTSGPHAQHPQATTTSTATPRPQPDGLTTRQHRLVRTVLFHGKPDRPCVLESGIEYGWSTLYVPARWGGPDERSYEPLCRVRESTLRGAFRAGALVHGPLDGWETPPGVLAGCGTPVLVTDPWRPPT